MADQNVGSKETKKKPIKVGNVVTGEDFFGREKEMARFIGLLGDGAHILMTGQRRIGKSSLLIDASKRLQEDAICLYVDVEHCDSAKEVIINLIKQANELRSRLGSTMDGFFNLFKGMRDSVEEVSFDVVKLKLREGAIKDWQEMGDNILDWLSKNEKPVYIFFDELPVFVNRIIRNSANEIVPDQIKDADIFLSWLRSKGIAYTGKLNFVICGSIGIEPVLEQVNLSDRINIFDSLHLSPWDLETSREFLQDRADGHKIELLPGVKELVMEKLGVGIPHFVQKFMQNIQWDCMERETDICGVDDVERIYKERMLAVEGSMVLATYIERLERTLGKKKFRLAKDLLTEAAVTDGLAGGTAMLIAEQYYDKRYKCIDVIRFLLKTFEHDGYLIQKENIYLFENNLLKDHWKKEFSFLYSSPVQHVDKQKN